MEAEIEDWMGARVLAQTRPAKVPAVEAVLHLQDLGSVQHATCSRCRGAAVEHGEEVLVKQFARVPVAG